MQYPIIQVLYDTIQSADQIIIPTGTSCLNSLKLKTRALSQSLWTLRNEADRVPVQNWAYTFAKVGYLSASIEEQIEKLQERSNGASVPTVLAYIVDEHACIMLCAEKLLLQAPPEFANVEINQISRRCERLRENRPALELCNRCDVRWPKKLRPLLEDTTNPPQQPQPRIMPDDEFCALLEARIGTKIIGDEVSPIAGLHALIATSVDMCLCLQDRYQLGTLQKSFESKITDLWYATCDALLIRNCYRLNQSIQVITDLHAEIKDILQQLKGEPINFGDCYVERLAA
jgi:hypothetical protein